MNLFINKKLKWFTDQFLNELDEIEKELKLHAQDGLEDIQIEESIKLLKERYRSGIQKDKKHFLPLIEEHIQSNETMTDHIIFIIGNNLANELESGEIHLYRGFLNPAKYGEIYLKIMQRNLDKAVRLEYITKQYAQEYMTQLMKNISDVG